MWSSDRRHQYALRDQVGDELGRERPARARHLGTSRVAGEDRLVVVERMLLRDVPVPDRVPVPFQIHGQRLGQGDSRDPEPRARQVGRL